MKNRMTKKDRIHLAHVYNAEGKEQMYVELRDIYEISNPSQVYTCMKKAPYLQYNEEKDRFMVNDSEINEANIFLDIDTLCSRKENTTKTSHMVKDENPVHKSMESIVQELIGERLLTLSQYVTLDTTSKILRLDKTSLSNDGYQLILH